MGFYFFAATVPLSYAGYAISRPGPNGEPSGIEKWLRGFESLSDTWAERNDIRTRLIEQAAHDKHLLFYAAGRQPHVELKTPEYVFPLVPTLLFPFFASTIFHPPCFVCIDVCFLANRASFLFFPRR